VNGGSNACENEERNEERPNCCFVVLRKKSDKRRKMTKRKDAVSAKIKNVAHPIDYDC
jgi:hypothetical protein